MLFQYSFSIEGSEWIIGLALMFALAFMLTIFTNKSLIGFFIYLTIFSGFVVWAELLPLWVLIVNIIILAVIIYYQLTVRKGREG